MKRLIAIFAFMLFISVAVFAQSQAVNITSGKMFISVSGNETSRLELNSDAFSSLGNITHIQTTTWYSNCNYPDCQPGTNFVTPSVFPFYDMHERGNFTINGVTHENVWYSGELNFSRENFTVPRIARKKGLVFFNGKFEMNGGIVVCKTNPFVSSCLPENLIYQGSIAGHGKMIVRLRSRFNSQYHWFRAENYEYIFEP